MKYLTTIFILILIHNLIYCQDDNLQSASDEICQCISLIDTSHTDMTKLMSEFSNCFNSTIKKHPNLIFNSETVIDLFEGGSTDCNKYLNFINYTISSSMLDSNLLDMKILSEVDCKKLLGKKYIQYEPEGVETIFNGNEMTETWLNTKYFVKSNVVWTGPCTYYMTLKDTNMKMTLQNYSYSDTILVDIIKMQNDSLILRSTNHNKIQVLKFTKSN